MAESAPQAALYTCGFCDAMAIVLHRLTGLPMALWVGELPPEDGEEPWIEPCHAVVLIENTAPTWLDVHGIHRGQPANLVFSEKPTRIWLQDVSDAHHRHQKPPSSFTTMSQPHITWPLPGSKPRIFDPADEANGDCIFRQHRNPHPRFPCRTLAVRLGTGLGIVLSPHESEADQIAGWIRKHRREPLTLAPYVPDDFEYAERPLTSEDCLEAVLCHARNFNSSSSSEHYKATFALVETLIRAFGPLPARLTALATARLTIVESEIHFESKTGDSPTFSHEILRWIVRLANSIPTFKPTPNTLATVL